MANVIQEREEDGCYGTEYPCSNLELYLTIQHQIRVWMDLYPDRLLTIITQIEQENATEAKTSSTEQLSAMYDTITTEWQECCQKKLPQIKNEIDENHHYYQSEIVQRTTSAIDSLTSRISNSLQELITQQEKESLSSLDFGRTFLTVHEAAQWLQQYIKHHYQYNQTHIFIRLANKFELASQRLFMLHSWAIDNFELLETPEEEKTKSKRLKCTTTTPAIQNIHALSDDVLMLCFSHLSSQELFDITSYCCKRFLSVICSTRFWQTQSSVHLVQPPQMHHIMLHKIVGTCRKFSFTAKDFNFHCPKKPHPLDPYDSDGWRIARCLPTVSHLEVLCGGDKMPLPHFSDVFPNTKHLRLYQAHAYPSGFFKKLTSLHLSNVLAIDDWSDNGFRQLNLNRLKSFKLTEKSKWSPVWWVVIEQAVNLEEVEILDVSGYTAVSKSNWETLKELQQLQVLTMDLNTASNEDAENFLLSYQAPIQKLSLTKMGLNWPHFVMLLQNPQAAKHLKFLSLVFLSSSKIGTLMFDDIETNTKLTNVTDFVLKILVSSSAKSDWEKEFFSPWLSKLPNLKSLKCDFFGPLDYTLIRLPTVSPNLEELYLDAETPLSSNLALSLSPLLTHFRIHQCTKSTLKTIGSRLKLLRYLELCGSSDLTPGDVFAFLSLQSQNTFLTIVLNQIFVVHQDVLKAWKCMYPHMTLVYHPVVPFVPPKSTGVVKKNKQDADGSSESDEEEEQDVPHVSWSSWGLETKNQWRQQALKFSSPSSEDV
jgi:hypothetical protein